MSKTNKYTRHNKDKYIVGAIFVVLMIAGFYAIWASSQNSGKTNLVATSTDASTSPISSVDFATSSVPSDTPAVALTSLDKFAQCLASKNLTMYGAVWCTHCQNQKKAFGTSWKYMKYVECPDNVQFCLAKGVEGYPTWITAEGKKLVGEQSFEQLAQATGCPLPK